MQPRRATSSHGGPGAAPTAAVALVRLVRLLAAALLLASVLLLVALVDQSVAAAAPPADRGSTAAAASRPAADVAVGGAGRPTAGMPRAAPGGRNPRPPALAEYADALGEAVAVLRRSPSDLVQGNLPAARRARATATPAAGEGPGVPPSPPAPSFQMWWPGSRDEREGEPLQPDGDGEPVNPAWDRALQLFPIGPPVYEVPPSPVSAGPGRVLPGPTGHPSIDEETGDRLYRWFLFPGDRVVRMRTKVSPTGRVTFEEGRPVGEPVTLRDATKVYFLFRAPDGEVAPLSTRVDQEGRAIEIGVLEPRLGAVLPRQSFAPVVRSGPTGEFTSDEETGGWAYQEFTFGEAASVVRLRTKVSPTGRVTFEEGRPVGEHEESEDGTKDYHWFRLPYGLRGLDVPLAARVDREGRAIEFDATPGRPWVPHDPAGQATVDEKLSLWKHGELSDGTMAHVTGQLPAHRNPPTRGLAAEPTPGERARGWATGQLRLSGSRGVSLWTRVKPRSGLALEETRERDSELVSVELSLLNGLRVPVRLRVRSTGRELYEIEGPANRVTFEEGAPFGEPVDLGDGLSEYSRFQFTDSTIVPLRTLVDREGGVLELGTFIITVQADPTGGPAAAAPAQGVSAPEQGSLLITEEILLRNDMVVPVKLRISARADRVTFEEGAPFGEPVDLGDGTSLYSQFQLGDSTVVPLQTQVDHEGDVVAVGEFQPVPPPQPPVPALPQPGPPVAPGTGPPPLAPGAPPGRPGGDPPANPPAFGDLQDRQVDLAVPESSETTGRVTDTTSDQSRGPASMAQERVLPGQPAGPPEAVVEDARAASSPAASLEVADVDIRADRPAADADSSALGEAVVSDDTPDPSFSPGPDSSSA